MKHLVFLFLLIAGSFFCWRYVMSRSNKRITGKWGRRVSIAVLLGAASVVALFAVLTLTSWKVF